MKETEVNPVQVQALRGVNQTPSERPDEFATLQNVAPDEVGRLTKISGKHLLEKRDGPVMTIHQFWTAYGYGSRISQTGGTGTIISDPEPPSDPGFKQPIKDFPLTCKPQKPYSNALALQYLDKRSDYIHIRSTWNRCAGTDFDLRVSLVECSILGLPIWTPANPTVAVVGYFGAGPIMEYTHGGQNILMYALDNIHGQESVVVNLDTLRKKSPGHPFTAKFQLRGYWFSYISTGNVVTHFFPKEKRKAGTYLRAAPDFAFPGCGKYTPKSDKANVGVFSNTPPDDFGQHMCYLYVKFFYPAGDKKERIWIDDV